jgi:pyruvate dehydrogenase E1 component alpha subunit
MNWEIVEDGHDVLAVRDRVAAALKLAHEQSRPSVLEIRTYRYRGHSVADPDTTYRDKKEIESYKTTKDPLTVFQHSLLAEKVLTEELVTKIDDAARAEAETSAQFAEASPYPTVEDIKKDVYWEVDNPADRKSGGALFFD